MPLFAVTIFLSAYLLFLVQPLIAKVILPWFGGSAAVWTTCLMFFQMILLAGYAYAHGSIRFLKPKLQTTLHMAMLGASVLVLPILPGAAWKPTDGLHPAARIVALLGVTVGAPYFALSTTGPLLQAWFSRRFPGRSPYRLYALSNAGSLLALLSYPVVIEPLTRLRLQAYTWSATYIGFVLFCGTVAWSVRGGSSAVAAATPDLETESERPGLGRQLLWIGLAFCPSTLLISVTSHMTQNISPVPLLWVAPLALYLLSFILTFESDRWYDRRAWFPLFIFAAALMLAFLFPDNRNAGLKIVIPMFAICFFICAMVCHGELYRLRPSPRWLTSFYLMISLGGALGGLFVGVAAPMIFPLYLELPIGLLLTVALIGVVLKQAPPSLPGPLARYIEYGLIAVLAGGFVYLLAWETPRWALKYRVIQRNFYGAIRVEDTSETEDVEPVRELQHGTISHGTEYLRNPFHRRPTTYYGSASGVGVALTSFAGDFPRSVGVVGLGAGTLSAYAKREDTYHFYEINPLVVDIARNQFFYLKECPAKVEITLGDARLSMERETPQQFDVLAVDAFSGDSIPVHLLTVEAFREYFRHLKPNGILAVHVSNKYLRLGSVVARAAHVLQKNVALITNPDDEYSGVYGSDWMMVTGDPDLLKRREWNTSTREKLPEDADLWTDDYSNLFKILK